MRREDFWKNLEGMSRDISFFAASLWFLSLLFFFCSPADVNILFVVFCLRASSVAKFRRWVKREKKKRKEKRRKGTARAHPITGSTKGNTQKKKRTEAGSITSAKEEKTPHK